MVKQYEKVYGQKAKKLKDINKFSIKVANNNDQYDDKIKDLNISLHQRKHINEEMSKKSFI